MIDSIPLMPLPYAAVKKLIRGYYPLASSILSLFPSLEKDLEEANSKFSAKEYLAGSLLSFTLYLIFLGFIFIIWAIRNDKTKELSSRLIVIFVPILIALLIFLYIMMMPRWFVSKKRNELERNLLFATRHMMIQTSAGVTLFETIVSISEEYGNQEMDYGAISKEFKKIVKDVRSGKELTQALEESASSNPSPYYRRIIWQLANANKSGTNVGPVLKNIVEFLSDEQRIVIRDYGSQLNPLALFYMLTCIIGPTMGLVLLMVASTFVSIPITDITFVVVLLFLLVVQVMFIGLIKSRRPKVAL